MILMKQLFAFKRNIEGHTDLVLAEVSCLGNAWEILVWLWVDEWVV